MKHDFVSRIVSAMLFGALFGCYTYYDYSSWSLRGKEAFITHQITRFDKYINNPTIIHCFGLAIFMLGIFVLYELVVVALVKIFKLITSHN